MKELIGLITVILAFAGHTPYVIDTYRKKTTPHIFTWLIWSFVSSIAFLGQVAKGGGPGSWSTGVTTVVIILVTLLTLRNKKTDITLSDKILFGFALVAIIPWYFTKDPTLSVIIATIIDACAFIPTIRKTLRNPKSETFTTYALNILRHTLSLVALSKYNVATVLYPAYLLCMNSLMTYIMLSAKKEVFGNRFAGGLTGE